LLFSNSVPYFCRIFGVYAVCIFKKKCHMKLTCLYSCRTHTHHTVGPATVDWLYLHLLAPELGSLHLHIYSIDNHHTRSMSVNHTLSHVFIFQWRDERKSAPVVSSSLLDDPTVQQPGCDVSRCHLQQPTFAFTCISTHTDYRAITRHLHSRHTPRATSS